MFEKRGVRTPWTPAPPKIAPLKMHGIVIPYSALFSRRLNFEVFADLILPAKIAPSKIEIDLKPHPFIIAACSVAKNQLLLSLIKSLYRYFTANKDPSGPLSRIVPSSSIEAANAKVRIQRRRKPIPKNCLHGSSSPTVGVQTLR